MIPAKFTSSTTQHRPWYEAKHNLADRNAGYLLTDKTVAVSGSEKCKVSVTKTNRLRYHVSSISLNSYLDS
jgi:hypothetical protein